jgi:hypothetical protein
VGKKFACKILKSIFIALWETSETLFFGAEKHTYKLDEKKCNKKVCDNICVKYTINFSNNIPNSPIAIKKFSLFFIRFVLVSTVKRLLLGTILWIGTCWCLSYEW